MKIRNIGLGLSVCLSASIPLSSLAESAVCGDQADPLISVSDFNGDGSVTGKDISLLAKEIGKGSYYSLYDRNTDGVLDNLDVTMASNEIGAVSSQTDQELAQMYQRFKHFQNIDGFDQISAMGYAPLGGPLALHGQHWMTQAGQGAIAGFRTADPEMAEGLNVTADGSDIPALFWGAQAVPLFNDPSSPHGLSPLDWPADPLGLNPASQWVNYRVQAFVDQGPQAAPDFFTDTTEDAWHTHAGVCLTLTPGDTGFPEWNIDQHTTNLECQALPNLAKVDVGSVIPGGTPGSGPFLNIWGNFWMLHVWMYDLNPNGIFANTHPCIDPDAPSEDDINGGREVPEFFNHHGTNHQ